MDTKEKNRTVTSGSKRPASAPSGKTGAAPAKKRRAAAPKRPSPDVVYTQPGPFNRNRFLLQLLTVAAVVLALLFGMSVFFKVQDVTVAGTNKYAAWDVRQASGIQDGENLLTISEAKISSNIRSKLPYVDKVRVGIKLPDTVKIEIVELDVVYAIESDAGEWWLMRADGGVVEKINNADAQLHTKVLGVHITQPKVGEPAKAFQPVSEETSEDGQPIPVTINAREQLDIAVSILQFLEDRSILGEVVSVDVTNINDLQMWYGDRFQIVLGDSTQLGYKIGLIKTAIDEYMNAYESGILDASLTIQPDPGKQYHVIYTPFDSE